MNSMQNPLVHCGLVIVTVVWLASANPAIAATLSASSVAELIAAIDAANQNAEPDSINLAAGTTFTLTLPNVSTNGPTGLPTISASESLSIFGNGSIIERSAALETPAFRLFDIAAEASLALENVTLQGGLTDLTWPSGGAIYNAGNLALSNVTVQNNVAQGRVGASCIRCDRGAIGGLGWNAFGGGIYSAGTLLMEDSTVRNNRVQGGRGGNASVGGGRGGDGRGGGLFAAAGTVTLLSSIVTGNVARGGVGGSGFGPGSSMGASGVGHGGGIYINSAQVSLDEFTAAHVTGNYASTNYPNAFGPFDVLPHVNPLPGDLNLDGNVDAADYVVWRKGLGATYTHEHYEVWHSHFGETSRSGSAAFPLGASAAPLPVSVPELSSLVLAAIAATAWALVCKSRYEVPRHPSAVDSDAAVLISSKEVIHV
jgi:hypothetical protein